MRRHLDLLSIALFLGAILAPTVDQLVRKDASRDSTPELRAPEPRPLLPWPGHGLRSFPSKYDRFYSDTFGLRDVLLRWNSLEKLYLFGIAPSSQLLAGDDRWIFYRGDKSVEVFRGLLPMETSELEEWRTHLELRYATLASRGIHYFFGIVPNKETIYPERMPASLTRVGPTRIDTFVPWMRAHSKVPIIDMREDLLAAKKDDQPGDYLYGPHGTHWDGRGAAVAYQAIMKSIRAVVPTVPIVATDELQWGEVAVGSDTWAGAMYIQDVLVQTARFPERRGGHTWSVVTQRKGPPKVTHVQQRGSDLESALFFHDSFGPSLTMLLGESFSPLHMHWEKYDPRVVAEVMPQIVVEIYVERALVYAPPGPGKDAKAYEIRPVFDELPHTLARVVDRWMDRFTTIDAMPVELTHEASGDALRFERKSATQGLVSPEITMPASGDVFARLDVECDSAFVLDVFWRGAAESEFKRSNFFGAEVSKGRSTFDVRLMPAGGPTQILLRPRESGRAITLRSFEVRSAVGL